MTSKPLFLIIVIHVMYLFYTADPRTKGFSREGILDSDKSRLFYSLTNKLEQTTFPMKYAVTEDICMILHLLTTRTKFFGRKFYEASDIIANDDILFIGALLMRTLCIIPRNAMKVDTPNN